MTISLNAIPLQLRIVWTEQGTLQGADAILKLPGTTAPLGPVGLADVADNLILQQFLDAANVEAIAQNAALTAENQALQSQFAALQAQIAVLENEKTALQSEVNQLQQQVSDLQNPPAPALKWGLLYAQAIASSVFQEIRGAIASGTSNALGLAYTELGFALQNGSALEEMQEGSGLAALQAAVTNLLALVSLSAESLVQLRTMLDSNGFGAIALP